MNKYNYISKFPKPFLEDLVNNKVVPVIGAGFSKNANIPKGKKILDWDELGEKFAELMPDYPNYNYVGAIDAISSYEHKYSRTKLIEKLSDFLLIKESSPGKAHEAFCSIPFKSVVTTNFDFLLENGYKLLNRYYIPIVGEDQLAIANEPVAATSLLKLHGDVHHPKRVVATEEDYDGFLHRFPLMSTYLANIFISNTILFIGYSLDDPDMRQISQLVKDRLGSLKRPAYTIRKGSTPQEIARFERRGVQVINIDSNKTYSEILTEIFHELRDYWTSKIQEESIVLEEKSLFELKSSKDISNNSRLCYFAVSAKDFSFYKQYIFPIVEESGFVPITPDNILTKGNNITADILSIIERSSVVIVDTSSESNFVSYENSIIDSMRVRNLTISKILITSKPISDPLINNITKNDYVIPKPIHIFKQLDTFVESIKNALTELYKILESGFEKEPQRLLGKKEYRAAVISAVTLLEIELKILLMKTNQKCSMQFLIDAALKENIIDQSLYNKIKEWIMIRNELAHQAQMNISATTAKTIVRSINDIVSSLKTQHGF